MSFGKKLARRLVPGDIVCLFGDLGAGKTTLVKGIAEGLGINKTLVNSPTFVLMNLYEGSCPLYHFDLYRIENEQSLAGIGIDEFLYGEGISVIEWAERLGKVAPEEFITVKLQHRKKGGRTISLNAKGKRFNGRIITE